VECLAGMVPRTELYRRRKLRKEGTPNDNKKNFRKINSLCRILCFSDLSSSTSL
jgi:hypothetical protein